MIQTPCWSDDEIGRIVKPDAEEISDHIFRAVHCPTELQIASSVDGTPMPESPESLITRFMDPRQNYVQAVVKGESGTGKSHLIQWMRLNIPSDEYTVMLTIPKTGTSLRGIIERVVRLLPEENRAEYLDRLDKSGTNATSKEAKASKFLDSLAWAIEHGGSSIDPADADLSALLPDILRDPHFRHQVFLVSGGAIEQIVDHVFVDPDKRDEDFDRREFHLGDLPLDGANHRNASKNAKDAIDFIIGESGMDSRAIALMNSNLNLAIAHTLNFSADHLIELMNSLRRHLAQQGKRLILLIEDFARTQGIDTALLQALITPPDQGDEVLCELRWAMAITTGPFKTIAQTVRTRSTIVVDMDLSVPASLEQFTSGYLNALRLGGAQLQELPRRGTVPSRCSLCDRKLVCFEAFGQVDGIGLFPFTKLAIATMADRSESRIDKIHFNPRKYLRSVLQTVVSAHYEELEHGEFPSLSLLKQIGGTGIVSPIDRQRMVHADPANAERRLTLLELWGDGSGKISNLSAGIHDAFGISQLPGVSELISTTDHFEGKSHSENTATTAMPIQSRSSNDIEALKRWANDGAMMSASVASTLRDLIYSLLDGAIDWDTVGYRKSMVSSPRNGPFRKLSISFQNQQTQPTKSIVMLEIGPNDVVSLHALLMRELHASWNFKDGSELLAHLLEALRTWKSDVESQLKRLYSGGSDWNPLTAVVELLTVSLYASGGLKISDTSIDTLLVRIWEDRPFGAAKGEHRPFNDIVGMLAKNTPKWVELLKGLASGTKGGQAGRFIRATPVFDSIRAIRLRSLQLGQKPPVDSPSEEMKELADAYRRVQNELISSLVAEKNNLVIWFSDVEKNIGPGTTITSLKDALSASMLALEKNSINVGPTRRALVEALEDIKPRVLDATLAHGRALSEANAADSMIRVIAICESYKDIDRLCAHATEFLAKAEVALASQREDLQRQSGAGLDESEEKIGQALESLSQSLDGIAGLCEDMP